MHLLRRSRHAVTVAIACSLACAQLVAGEADRPGLVGEYFALSGLSDLPVIPAGTKPTLVRVDKQVNFKEVTGQFHGSKLTDNFYARWSGVLRVTKAGSHGFTIESDDGSRLSIDGKVVVDNPGVHAMAKKSGQVELSAGDHPILIEYFQGAGGAGVLAHWAPPGSAAGPIPAAALFHAPAAADIAWDKAAWDKLKVAAGASNNTAPYATMDHGPFMTHTIAAEYPAAGNTAYKGSVIRLAPAGADGAGQAHLCFDSDLLRVSCAWTDAFVNFPNGRDGLEGHPQVPGNEAFGTLPGPGWAKGGSFTDPRANNQGPLPVEWGRYQGLYLHGEQVVLSYRIGGADVAELPAFDQAAKVFTRTFSIDKGTSASTLLVCEDAGATAMLLPRTATAADVAGGKPGKGPAGAHLALLVGGDLCRAVAVVDAPQGATLQITEGGRVHLALPGGIASKPFTVAVWNGATDGLPGFTAWLAKAKSQDPRALCKGGPARWTKPVTTTAVMGDGAGPYVVDTLTVPYENPWGSYMRVTALDFLSDGRAVVSTIDGDVWVVSGIADQLATLTWKRFATGMFQTLGLRIVGDQVHVLGRDQLTRLHDLDADGEADFYENVNNQCVVTDNYHEFALDLQTDPEGNFYYMKGSPWPPQVTSPHQGCVMKVSKDGSSMQIIATGLRAPVGMSDGPKGRFTFSDNQGHWMPACKVSLIKPGAFYGMMPAAHREPNPTDFEKPVCWLPMSMDNSSGGQLWVTSDKWGPFKDSLVHMSYGKGWLFSLLVEEVGGQMQGGMVRFPLDFASGIMRARFGKDGQLYVVGMRGWQTSGNKAGALQRVRYTGAPVHMPIALAAGKRGVTISFANPLDPATAADKANYAVEQWNYNWSGNYGSDHYKISDPKQKGADQVEVTAAVLSKDGRSVTLEYANPVPAMQMKIKLKIAAADGAAISHEIYSTINQIGN